MADVTASPRQGHISPGTIIISRGLQGVGEALVYTMKMKIHYTVVETDTKFTHDVFKFAYALLLMNIVIINRGVTTGKGGTENFFTE